MEDNLIDTKEETIQILRNDLIVENPDWWKQKLQVLPNWKMYNDNVVVYESVKGRPSTQQGIQFDVVKFLVTMEKS